MKFSPNRIHYSRTALSNNIKCYPIQYMYVPFQKWNCYGIVPFLQFNSHSFDSISCQFIIPLQFTLKVENSRIIPIPKFEFQCPGDSSDSLLKNLAVYQPMCKYIHDGIPCSCWISIYFIAHHSVNCLSPEFSVRSEGENIKNDFHFDEAQLEVNMN